MKKETLKKSSVLVIACICWLGLTGCARNVDEVKERSAQTAKQLNLEIVCYEGYVWDAWSGGNVWYQFRRSEDNGILYMGYLIKRPFTDEIHLCNFRAIDAIKP